MFIAKDNDLIILARNTREELEQDLQFMVYTDIVETDIEYELYYGSYLTKEEIAQKERERISNLEISQEKFWNFMLPITKQMAIDKIKDFPEIGKKMLIEIDNPTYKRSSIIVDAIAGLYNIEDETVDNLFQS